MRRRMTILLALAMSALAAAGAGATPQSDFDAVYGDWKADLVISACKWSQGQLQNAYDVSQSNPDFQYETRFGDDVQKEIKRWKDGGCAGVKPIAVRRTSPLSGARIVKVSGRGKAAKEVVRVRNGTKKTIPFRKGSIRNSKRGKAVFPAKFKLPKGKTAVIHVGCKKGKRRAYFKKQNVWLCLRKPLFNDKGDLARLADAKAIVVSQRGFGKLKRRPAF
jgi:hypothetical protein